MAEMSAVRFCWTKWRVTRPLRKGKGTRENPLTMKDLRPLMRALKKLER